MDQITIRAYGKINLTLDITGKRKDGYHLLEMIMQSVDIYDTVNVKKSESNKITIKCSEGDAPSDDSNVAYKAAELMISRFEKAKAVDIDIIKRIPAGAGMAGGSSDAAAVLFAMDRLFDLGLTEDELKDMGLKLGADVPFCLKGGTVFAKGIGEDLTFLEFMPLDLIVIKPEDSVSTDRIYKNVDINKITKRPDNKNAVKAIKDNDKELLISSMYNVLEPVTAGFVPVISDIEKKLAGFGAVSAMMTGSGSAVFGIFDDEDIMNNAYTELLKIYENVYMTKTVTGGLTVEKWN